MKRFLSGALLMLMCVGTAASAQDNGARPAPQLLQIFRETLKPGHSSAHEKLEARWANVHRNSKSGARYLAMTTITGQSEAWFMSGYPSYEAMEKQAMAEEADAAATAQIAQLSAADGPMLEGVRTITARFVEDLSMRPALNIGDYRYMQVTIVRVRPGMQNRFAENRRMIKAAHEKLGMKDYYSVFEVESGIAGPMFLVFVPMKSMKEADEAGPMHSSAAYREALGGDEGRNKMRENASAAIVNTESYIFKFNPAMSSPPAEYAIGNGDFWSPKPAGADAKAKAKAAPKKPE